MEKKYSDEEVQIFNNILHDYSKIDSDTELCNRNLEYKDYKNLGFIIDSLRYDKKAVLSSKTIADWLQSFGCTIGFDSKVYIATL